MDDVLTAGVVRLASRSTPYLGGTARPAGRARAHHRGLEGSCGAALQFGKPLLFLYSDHERGEIL